MSDAPAPVTRRIPRTDHLPGYVRHPSFDGPSAPAEFGPNGLLRSDADLGSNYMPDDVTRDHARRMHYAAHRARTARRAGERALWHSRYLTLRDRIVLGNHKLVYRAVRRRMAVSNRAEDMVGDCQIVLIQAVAAFNPWLNIRFSTYAYTCLVRAIGRLSQRLCTDWLVRAIPLQALPDGEPWGRFPADPASSGSIRIDEFLQVDHPLLSDREKTVLARRFSLTDVETGQTLAHVGRDLGLSKERVRQVQASALDKLRRVLSPAGADPD